LKFQIFNNLPKLLEFHQGRLCHVLLCQCPKYNSLIAIQESKPKKTQCKSHKLNAKKTDIKHPKKLQQQNMCILQSQTIFKSLLLIWDHITEYYQIMFILDHSKLTYLGLPIITRM
jgi:hypothetical protein